MNKGKSVTHVGPPLLRGIGAARNSPFVQLPEDGGVTGMERGVNFQELQNVMWDDSTFLYQ